MLTRCPRHLWLHHHSPLPPQSSIYQHPAPTPPVGSPSRRHSISNLHLEKPTVIKKATDKDVAQLLAFIGDGDGHLTTFQFDALIRKAKRSIQNDAIGHKARGTVVRLR